MKKLDRRAWLRTAGLTGAFSMLGGLSAVQAKDDTVAPLAAPPIEDAIARLSSNENPMGPSPKARQAMIEAFEWGCRYPYYYATELAEMIAKKHGVSRDLIVLGSGSSEGLKCTALAFGLHGAEIISAAPTYLSLLSYAEHFGAHINMVPLDDDLVHDLDAMGGRITNQTGLVFVCNPNNPTGTILPAEKLKDFCRDVSSQVNVFVDEAYFEYIQQPYPSMIELVKEEKNVIVSRTFSKVYGLAGIRMGYLVARPDIADRIRKKRMSMLNVLAINAAKAALQDEKFYQASLAQNTATKQLIYNTLDDLKLKYVPSSTNFVFFHTGKDIGEVIPAMLEHKVRVGRPFPPLRDWCRISTGTTEDVKLFCKSLRKMMV